MACRICGRQSCTECFHSIEEQEEYEQHKQDLEEEAHLMTEPEEEE